MNRLEKKCFLASVGLHAFLGLAFLGASAFMGPNQLPPVDTLPPITIVPTRLVDDLVPPGGGGNPEAALPPAPVEPGPQPVPPEPTAVAPEPPPPRPEPEVREDPKPTVPERPEPAPARVPKPDPAGQQDKPSPKRHEIKISTKKVALSDAAEQAKAKAREEDARRRAAAEARARVANKIGQLSSNLRSSFSSGTTIGIPGPGGEAYANYGQEVQRLYHEAWNPPGEIANQYAMVVTRIVVARNGTIRSDGIVQGSGISALDRSVTEALFRVRARGLPPFPEGAKDIERTFTIRFNLRSKIGM